MGVSGMEANPATPLSLESTSRLLETSAQSSLGAS